LLAANAGRSHHKSLGYTTSHLRLARRTDSATRAYIVVAADHVQGDDVRLPIEAAS
jgi:hypothetical protein